MSNACSESACCKHQQMSISSLIEMSHEAHEAVPPRSFDEWTDAAIDCLQQDRERGIPESEASLATKMIERAFAEQDSNRLQALVAKFEKAIQDYDARLSASTAALAAFSNSSIPVHSTSDTIARNAPALRHEDAEALPPYGTALGAPALLDVSHDHAASPAAPADDGSFYHDPHAHKSHNAPASLNEYTAALPRYVGTAPWN
jgi:hypothetical protein